MNIRLNVKCTYSVDCEFDDVPEKILEMDEVKEGTDVYDWLSDNIREGDACDWEFDIMNAEKMEGGEE